MQKLIKRVLPLVAVTLVAPGLAAAQDDAPSVYTYATYFYCNVSKEERADELMMADAAAFDAVVDSGAVRAWGWMAHNTGGKWRRIRWHQSDSVVGTLKALGALNEAGNPEETDPNDEFGQACSSHDDYIWQAEAGKNADQRGKVGMSVYFVCKLTGEDRADEIVKSNFAPIYDKAVDDGKLTSWGWQSHVVGGKYRRLSTMTATDWESLFAARAEMLDAMYGAEGDNAVGREFAEICYSHSDYLWDIRHEKSGG